MLWLVFFAQAINFYSLDGIGDLSPEEQLHAHRVNNGLYSVEQLPILTQIGSENALRLHLLISRRVYGAESNNAITSLYELTRYIVNTYQDPLDLHNLYQEFHREIEHPLYLRAKSLLLLTLFEHHVTAPLHAYNIMGMTSAQAQNFEVSRSYMMLRGALKDYQAFVENNPDSVPEYNQFVDKFNRLINEKERTSRP